MKKIMIVAMALASTVAFADHHEGKDHKADAAHAECAAMKDAAKKKECEAKHAKDHHDGHKDEKAHH
jgi:uncharacterized protein YdeI (BOF family)